MADAPGTATTRHATPPELEARRLAALRATGLLERRGDEALDRLTRLAARVLRVPVVLASLVAEERQLFAGCVGLPEPWASTRETPIAQSFCRHVVDLAAPLIIADARRHPLVWDNPAIRDLGVVAYAGFPLVSADGEVLGSFCAIDHVPREWSEAECAILADLAAAASTEIDLRMASRVAADSEARLALAMEAARLGAWSFDVARGVRWNSARASELLGLDATETELTVDEWASRVLPEDAAAARAAFARAAAGDGAYAAEYRVPLADGSVRWLRSGGLLLRSADGAPSRLVGTLHDETERKRAEELSRAGEARLRAFVEAVPLLAWTNDAGGVTTFFNGRWYRYVAREEGEGSPAGWMDVVHPEDRARIAGLRDAAIRLGRPYDLEVRLRRHDGEHRWHSARVEPIVDAAGAVVAWSGAAFDLHERRELEQQLRASEARLRAVQESTPDASLTFRAVRDEAGRIADFEISYANGAAAAALGAEASAVGARMRETFPDAVSAGRLEEYARLVETGVPFQRDTHYTRGAVRRDFRVAAVRVEDGVHLSLVDVTARASAAAERERLLAAAEAARADAERARQEAESANAVKAQFLATMSHELRTPLNAIGGYAELIAMGIRGPVTPDQLSDLARIQRSQQHLLGLINEVLNYAKLEAGTVTFDVVEVPLAEIVRAVEPLVAPQARRKQLVLTIDACPQELVARADAEKARQIVLNLLSNAVKFTAPGGAVRVTCTAAAGSAAGARVAVRVSDTGRGIAPAQIQRVFDPFVQVGRRLNSVEEGTGLGLAISRDLAHAMGGELSVESTLGVGSTFTLTLPAA